MCIRDRNNTVIFNERGEIYLSLWDRENEERIIGILKKELPQVLAADSHKIFRNLDGTLFSIVGRVIPYRGRKYVAFYFTE